MSRFQTFRKHFPVGAVALEVFSIVLGVGLALAAGQWVESQRETRRTTESVEVLANEIAENQNTLQIRLDIRRELEFDLESGLAPVMRGEPRIDLDSLTGVDLGIVPFNSAAYETMLANGTMSNLDIDTSVPITRIYALLETTSEMDIEVRRLVSEFDYYDVYVNRMADPSKSVNTLRSMLNLTTQIKTNEITLLRRNRHLLRHLALQGISVDTSATPVDSLGAPSTEIEKARDALQQRQNESLTRMQEDIDASS